MSVASLKGFAISRNERGGKKGENGFARKTLAPMIRQVFFFSPSPTGVEIAGGKQARNKRERKSYRRTTSFVRRVHLHNEIISFCPRMEP